MGRIFEKRKHKMFARFDKMAKAFTRIGKDIAIAVKQAGPNPDNNPKLRMAMQNAKGLNMPKDRVDSAIKRASSKEEKDFQQDEEEITVYTKFTEFGHFLKFLESKKLEAKSSALQYIPTTTKELSEADQDEVLKCIEAIEEDEDVQTVYHNLA